MSDEAVWANFSRECTVCGATIQYLDGERVPSECDHALPALVIDGDESYIDWGDAEPTEEHP